VVDNKLGTATKVDLAGFRAGVAFLKQSVSVE
jgi:hypothetical protein